MDTNSWPSCRWTTAVVDETLVESLSAALSVPRTLAKCLLNRGISTYDEADLFIRPRLDRCLLPDAMPGIVQAADIISRHVAAQHKILVFGDYDADGITAAVALSKTIRALGGDVSIFIPDRQTEGYGFTLSALRRCLTENGNPSLIVTVDCGISQSEACREATSRGIEVVITDHHSITEAVPETASAIVNPALPGTPEPLAHLCGAGVAFKLAHQLLRQAHSLSKDDARRFLNHIIPMVAIGTVADLVPLSGENRIIVNKGLDLINSDDCGGNEGIRALKYASSIFGDATAGNLSFAIAPRINAAGRVGDPAMATALLNAETPAEAKKFAAILERDNEKRREEETNAVIEAEGSVKESLEKFSSSIVLFNDQWHPGIIGLVASRLVSKYRLPVVVITSGEEGIARGSSRCPEHTSLDLMPLLEACAPLLTRYGGHKVAAGLSLSKVNIEPFRAAFDLVCKKASENLDLRSEMMIDDWLQPDEINDEMEKFLRTLEPCGMNNPTPRLGVRGLTLESDPRCFGKTRRNNWELSFQETEVKGVLFHRDTLEFRAGDRLDVVFTLSSNSFGPVQMIVRDAARVQKTTSLA